MWYSKYLSIFLLLLAAFLTLSLVRIRPKQLDLLAELDYVESKIQEMELRQEELEKHRELLQNSSYLERELRTRLNYKRPDEEAVLIYRNEAVAQEKKVDDPESLSASINNFWNQLGDWINFE